MTARIVAACSSAALAIVSAGCLTFYEVPVETPIRAKLDVSSFQRVLIAGFIAGGAKNIDPSAETARLLRSQLRSKSELARELRNSRGYFSESDFAMKSLARETGARAFFPAEVSELIGIYSSIAEELASQYALGYASKNPRVDGSYRRVIVRVNQNPGVRTRTRNGYLSARSN